MLIKKDVLLTNSERSLSKIVLVIGRHATGLNPEKSGGIKSGAFAGGRTFASNPFVQIIRAQSMPNIEMIIRRYIRRNYRIIRRIIRTV